ncbi:M56 family metallopeptidase [Luteolibacter soli]|uniref:M56 family metallopeptidase n=1 Tax=Luteolibacter soli TaxID=3135280 RepID=A0ABU9ANE1_9BACT
MSLPDHYLVTVALHALVLSTAVFLAILCLRRPQRISVVALCGTLAIALLPWISAMRPQSPAAPKSIEQSGASTAVTLPEWTVVRIPMVETSTPATPVSSSSFEMPETATLVTAIWALGGMLAFIPLMLAVIKLLRWRRTLARPDDAAWQAIHQAEPDLPSRCHFRISPVDASPCVTGFFKPVIVIPPFLLDPAKRRELRWALRHELRHWQGADSRWIMALEWMRITQWWNPFVHLLVSRWKMAREQVCDIAASDDDRATYGEFLIEMAAQPSSPHPLAVTMVRQHRLKTLKTRIVTILAAAPGTVTRLEKSVLFSACLAMLGAALVISCVKVGDPVKDLQGSSTSIEQVAATSEEEGPAKRLQSGFAAQVKIQTKVIVADTQEVQGGSVLTDAEMQQLMRKFAQKKGTDLMTFPVVTARTDEMALIEILREHPDDPPWQTDFNHPELRKNRFAGWSIRVAPTYDDGKIRVRAEVGYGYVPGGHYSPDAGAHSMFDKDEKIDWKKLVRKDATGRGTLNAGETLAIDLGKMENNRFGTIFFTLVPISPTGFELKSFKEAARRRPVVVAGKLKLRGTILEREFFEELVTAYLEDVPVIP